MAKICVSKEYTVNGKKKWKELHVYKIIKIFGYKYIKVKYE